MKQERIDAITVGTTIGTSRSAVAFADTHPEIWATVGYHPEHFTSSYHDEAEGDTDQYSLKILRSIAMSSKKVVAIGETGLDFYRIDTGITTQEAHQKQEKGLRDQISLAAELDLPLVIHSRDAFSRLTEILNEEQQNRKNIRGVIHCFTGTWTEAKSLLRLGFYLSFTGIITFPPKKTQDPETHIHRIIERMPSDRILAETDAPWLTPIPYRGKRNEPMYVRYVNAKIAELRRISEDEAAKLTTQNARELFRI